MSILMKHEAIRALYPSVGGILQEGEKFTAYDNDMNVVAFDDTAVNAKAAELWIVRQLDMLRQERNRRIAETDWWASSDLTITAEQTAYRQALRDITNTYTSLDDVVWPEKP